MSLSSFFTVLMFVTTSLAISFGAQASPTHPWDDYSGRCKSIQQDDGKKIGAICTYSDREAQTRMITVYYFGYLFQNHANYEQAYVNLSVQAISHEKYMRMGLRKVTLGDGHNLPKVDVLTADFVLCGSLTCHLIPNKSDFSLYFQAEQKHPTRSPPFEYDNLFGSNYRGHISLVPRF